MNNFDISEVTRLNLIRILEEENINAAELSRQMGKTKQYIGTLTKPPKKNKDKDKNKKDSARGLGAKVLNEICVALDIDKMRFYRFDVLGLELSYVFPEVKEIITYVFNKKFKHFLELYNIYKELDPSQQIAHDKSIDLIKQQLQDSLADKVAHLSTSIVDIKQKKSHKIK
jgi:hypothetical protein